MILKNLNMPSLALELIVSLPANKTRRPEKS
jgi:hypothetical protein